MVPTAPEPRAAIGEHDAGDDQYTLWTTSQNPHVIRLLMGAIVLGIPEHRLRVVAPDVGGGFGSKIPHYAEEAFVTFAAKVVGRPVKWTSSRSEAFVSDAHGRDHVTRIDLALDNDGKFLALRTDALANMGAYLSLFGPCVPTYLHGTLMAGPYATPLIHVNVRAIFTNTVPVDAYRGAGRPEATFQIERVVDKAARELGMEPTELRRINFVKPSQMPYKTAAGELYDTGEFERVMATCMVKAGYDGIAARKKEAGARGKYRGIGMCYYIESTMGDPTEHAKVEFGEDGHVSVLVGTQSNGQGHETAYAQVLHQRLGVPYEKIRIVQGDTVRI
jgi:carbon-monoxide dehydrogenase large subunit